MKTKLTATFTDVSLNTSVYRIWTDLTLAMYYGDVDVSGMGNRRRIAVQPALTQQRRPRHRQWDPKNLIVYNFSEWTRMFGQDYEVFVFDPTGATLGFALQEVSYEQAQQHWDSIIVGGVLIILYAIRVQCTCTNSQKFRMPKIKIITNATDDADFQQVV